MLSWPALDVAAEEALRFGEEGFDGRRINGGRSWFSGPRR